MSAEGDGVMLMKRLKGAGIITKAANHNKRTHGASSANPALLHLNSAIRGPATAVEVSALAKRLMAAAGVDTLRKDAVAAIEIVFSLPAGTAIPLTAYFAACAAWAASHFGGEDNILSADIHLDEPQPHCHVLILPLVDEKMNGSDMFGSNAKRQSLQVSFHAEVGSLYGLRRAPPRLSGAAKQAGVAQVLDKLTANDAPVLVSAVWATTCDAIARYPDPFMQALGITPQTKPQRSFEQIALSTGKGPKTAVGAASRDRRLMTGATSAEPIHIGFQPDCEDRNLSCVGIAQYLPALPLPTGWPEADAAHHAQVLAQSLPQGGAMAASPPNCPYEHIRERDSDRESGDWDTETGEFVDRCPPPTPWIKAAAREVVEAAV